MDDNNDNKSELTKEVEKHVKNFQIALSDDLSMPRAAASLFAVVKAAEKQIKKKEDFDMIGLHAVKNALTEMDSVFGIFYEVPMSDEEIEKENAANEVPAEVMELVNARSNAKECKDWGLADELRDRITELGFQVKDVKGGVPEITPLEV